MIVVLVGQYTYTACEAPGPYSSVPGWKVKQVLPAPPALEIPEGAVKAAVRPFGGFRTPIIGPLTTQPEIDQLPRCLRLDRLPEGYLSLAHLAAAGRDRSGRDAFFAHGLLVVQPPRENDIDGPAATSDGWLRLRPADYWGADGWLTPNRAEAIEAAMLGAPPRLSPASPRDEDRRGDFIELHPGQREFVLAAAERALAARVPLVVVGLPVEAAMWTSMITHFLLPSTGWSMPFSTYEAGPGPEVLRSRFAAVIGVPTESADAWRQIPGDAVTVHDPTNPAGRTPHGFVLSDGTSLPIGRWARLAEAVCEVGWEDDIRTAIDELGVKVDADVDQWPLFALPAAVLGRPESDLAAHPDLALLAVSVMTGGLPPVSKLPPDLLATLIQATTTSWGSAATVAATTREILKALDPAGGGAPTELTDPILGVYVRELLKSDGLGGEAVPWLPATARLSADALRKLAADLPVAVRWLDTVEPEADRAACIVTLAGLVDAVGLTAPATLGAAVEALADRARQTVVSAMLPGPGVDRGAVAGWPPIPPWLWHEGLVDALAARLDEFAPGSVLGDPAIRRLVDQVAGPLPARYVRGRTLTGLSYVDCERAAALVRAGLDGALPAEQRAVIGAAAFLRFVLTSKGTLRIEPEGLLAEGIRCFGDTPPNPIILLDLLDQLWDARVPIDRLGEFASAVLEVTPPDRTMIDPILRWLQDHRLPVADLVEGSLGWHQLMNMSPPLSSSDIRGHLSRPDTPQTRLLEAVATRGLPRALMPAGLTRMARWIVILPAQFLSLPGNARRLDRMDWLVAASREPLAGELGRQYGSMATWLVDTIDKNRTRPPVAADSLAAEWVVRAALIAVGVASDPASSFFAEENGQVWRDCAQRLLRPAERDGRDADNWLHRVELSAIATADVAFPGIAPDQGAGRALVDKARDIGTQLLGAGGNKGWLKRPSSVRGS